MHEPESVAPPEELGRRVRELRSRSGLTRRALAKRSGLPISAIAGVERGRGEVSSDDLAKIAAACGAGPDDLDVAPSASDLSLVSHDAQGHGAGTEIRGDAAFEALLREYLSMVLELRSNQNRTPDSLRHEDLTELARALGGSAEAIEARLVELLGSGEQEAWELRMAILPSHAPEATAPLAGT
jgi:transcriptional regulator with XRE-family HTH domain